MANKKHARHKRIKRQKRIRILLTLLVAVISVGFLGALYPLLNNSPNVEKPDVSDEVSSESVKKEPYKIASASIGSTGDLLIHDPVFKGVLQSDGSYDFTDIFTTVKPYFEEYDLMVANLEVTLAGDSRAYSGYPIFNCPDSIVDAAVSGGIDMLLTANNHTYDTGFDGLVRTMEVLKEKSVPFLGTRQTESDSLYTIKEINGIKIGMVCYTYSTTTSDGRKALNGNVLKTEAGPLVNTFDYYKLDEFYAEAKSVINEMKQKGAEATMIYIHWGNEYVRKPNSYQTTMAQEICNMGYDVIIGGHPHVLEPIETLKSENGHETVCLYSTGNTVSNQRKERMDSDNYSGHTEDGIILGVTFDKYSDGKVVLSDVSVLPLWVDMTRVNGKNQYKIIPLDINFVEDWDKLVMTKVSSAKLSFNRTMKIVGEGINEYRKSHGLSEYITEVE